MTPTSSLAHGLHEYLSQCQKLWCDVEHLQTLCWIIISRFRASLFCQLSRDAPETSDRQRFAKPNLNL